jgi:hypothetical protein
MWLADSECVNIVTENFILGTLTISIGLYTASVDWLATCNTFHRLPSPNRRLMMSYWGMWSTLSCLWWVNCQPCGVIVCLVFCCRYTGVECRRRVAVEELRPGGSCGVHSWIEGASGDGRRVSWFAPQIQGSWRRLKTSNRRGTGVGLGTDGGDERQRRLGPSEGRGGNGV